MGDDMKTAGGRAPLLLPGRRHVTSAREADLAEAVLSAQFFRREWTEAVEIEARAFQAVVDALERWGPRPREADIVRAVGAWEAATRNLTAKARSVEGLQGAVGQALLGLVDS